MKISIHRNKVRFVLYIKLSCTLFKICILIGCVCVIVRFQYKRNTANSLPLNIISHACFVINPKNLPAIFLYYIFTSRRNARIASAVLAMTFPSVCLSVHPSVTHRQCQNDGTQHGAVCAVRQQNVSSFVKKQQKICPRDDPFPLKCWLQVTYPLLIAAILDTFCLVAPQR